MEKHFMFIRIEREDVCIYNSGDTLRLIIREARDCDIEKMYSLDKLCFDIDAFTKRQLKYLIHSKTVISLVAEMDGDFAGFIIGFTNNNRFGKYGRVYSLDVESRFRRMGIAKALMDVLTENLRDAGCIKCFLEVKLGNTWAIPLYEKMGFTHSHIIPNYYKMGEPALKMKKSF